MLYSCPSSSPASDPPVPSVFNAVSPSSYTSLSALQCTHHTKKPPHRLTRLCAHPKPVFRADRVELQVFVSFLLVGGGVRAREGDAWRGIVGPEYFHGAGVARCSVGFVSR
jgi:hypothetical protein